VGWGEETACVTRCWTVWGGAACERGHRAVCGGSVHRFGARSRVRDVCGLMLLSWSGWRQQGAKWHRPCIAACTNPRRAMVVSLKGSWACGVHGCVSGMWCGTGYKPCRLFTCRLHGRGDSTHCKAEGRVCTGGMR
jgi:hypothetical protein